MVEPNGSNALIRVLEGRVERLEQTTDSGLDRVQEGLSDVGTKLSKVQAEVAELRTDFAVAEATRVAKARRDAGFAGGAVSAIVVAVIKIAEVWSAA